MSFKPTYSFPLMPSGAPLSLNRRHTLTLALMVGLPMSTVWALSIPGITDAEASSGLKAALEKAGLAAIGLLGQQDGFLGNAAVKIPLPGILQDVAKVAKVLGMGKQIDELTVSMNRAAESAVPQAKDMLVGAAKGLTLTDAKNILTGGETSVTEFFKSKTETPLFGKFLPIVASIVSKVGLAQQYNGLVEKLPVKGKAGKIENHVTTKSLTGMFYMIGQQEIGFRQNPLGAGGGIIGKVFGAIK
jgi:Protein of unknown function (DUF4197)